MTGQVLAGGVAGGVETGQVDAVVGAPQVVPALGQHGQQRRQGQHDRDYRREGLDPPPEEAENTAIDSPADRITDTKPTGLIA